MRRRGGRRGDGRVDGLAARLGLLVVGAGRGDDVGVAQRAGRASVSTRPAGGASFGAVTIV